eukprot:gene24346-31267_t
MEGRRAASFNAHDDGVLLMRDIPLRCQDVLTSANYWCHHGGFHFTFHVKEMALGYSLWIEAFRAIATHLRLSNLRFEKAGSEEERKSLFAENFSTAVTNTLLPDYFNSSVAPPPIDSTSLDYAASNAELRRVLHEIDPRSVKGVKKLSSKQRTRAQRQLQRDRYQQDVGAGFRHYLGHISAVEKSVVPAVAVTWHELKDEGGRAESHGGWFNAMSFFLTELEVPHQAYTAQATVTDVETMDLMHTHLGQFFGRNAKQHYRQQYFRKAVDELHLSGEQDYHRHAHGTFPAVGGGTTNQFPDKVLELMNQDVRRAISHITLTDDADATYKEIESVILCLPAMRKCADVVDAMAGVTKQTPSKAGRTSSNADAIAKMSSCLQMLPCVGQTSLVDDPIVAITSSVQRVWAGNLLDKLWNRKSFGSTPLAVSVNDTFVVDVAYPNAVLLAVVVYTRNPPPAQVAVNVLAKSSSERVKVSIATSHEWAGSDAPVFPNDSQEAFAAVTKRLLHSYVGRARSTAPPEIINAFISVVNKFGLLLQEDSAHCISVHAANDIVKTKRVGRSVPLPYAADLMQLHGKGIVQNHLNMCFRLACSHGKHDWALLRVDRRKYTLEVTLFCAKEAPLPGAEKRLEKILENVNSWLDDSRNPFTNQHAAKPPQKDAGSRLSTDAGGSSTAAPIDVLLALTADETSGMDMDKMIASLQREDDLIRGWGCAQWKAIANKLVLPPHRSLLMAIERQLSDKLGEQIVLGFCSGNGACQSYSLLSTAAAGDIFVPHLGESDTDVAAWSKKYKGDPAEVTTTVIGFDKTHRRLMDDALALMVRKPEAFTRFHQAIPGQIKSFQEDVDAAAAAALPHRASRTTPNAAIARTALSKAR